MDEGAVEAVVTAVELEVEAQGVGHEAHHAVACLAAGPRHQPLQVRGHHLGALGDVQAEGHRKPHGWVTARAAPQAARTAASASGSTPAFHSMVGAVLPGERYEPTIITSRSQQPRQVWLALQGQGHVRQRPQRHQRQLARARAAGAQDGRRRILEHGAGRRCREGRVSQPRRAVRVRGRAQRPDQGTLGPRGHGDVRPTGQLQHGQRVAHDVRQLHVAGHAGDTHDLGFRRGDRVEQRQGVVDARVAIDEQRGAPGGRHDPCSVEPVERVVSALGAEVSSRRAEARARPMCWTTCVACGPWAQTAWPGSAARRDGSDGHDHTDTGPDPGLGGLRRPSPSARSSCTRSGSGSAAGGRIGSRASRRDPRTCSWARSWRSWPSSWR